MARSPIPAEIKPEWITAIIDTREQTPLYLAPLRTESGTLATGDYSAKGLEHVIALERKSLPDLLACIGTERERFDREIQRLLSYPSRAIVIESTLERIEQALLDDKGKYTYQHHPAITSEGVPGIGPLISFKSKVKPAAAVGSLLSWQSMGIPVVFAGDHVRAGRYVSKMLFLAARHRWRESRALISASMDIANQPVEAPSVAEYPRV